MPTPDPASIAKSLPTVQRLRLLGARNGQAKMGRFNRRAINALCDAGLATPVAWSAQGVTEAELTPLGLAVRDLLTKERDDD
jgi:hypothetical protein